ncbi:MAG TPA: 50S ribosomal protein L25 [Candidatus Saccharimonadales bacterium]|nr:50S ribosomal protein L25 [Candidatus Saccharimonadales bacterium]
MQKHSLAVEKRTLLGKKVKKLRKEGLLPGNVFGKDFSSEAVQMPTKAFLDLFEQVGHSGLVEVKVDGKVVPTLIHGVTYDHINQVPLHVDFYKVNLKEKVRANVPVVLVGEPLAVTEKLGLLMQNMHEVEVEALPADLPENVEIDVTHLAQVGESVRVSDIKVGSDVTVLNEPEQEIARIAELVSKEAEEQAQAEEAAAEAASESAETPAEGEETPAEETAPEAPAENQ